MIEPTIHSMADLEARLTSASRVVCLYSGGLDGTFLLHRLREIRCARVVALSVNLGGDFEREAVEARAHSLGAEAITVDAGERFVRDFVQPAVVAQATYLNGHPICASLSRPLIAQIACEYARRQDCDTILHTSTRSQNSLRRFNGALSALGFAGNYGSPYAATIIPREEKQAELVAAGVAVAERHAFSEDTNLWGREFEFSALDDPENFVVPEHLYRWSANAADSRPITVSITFAAGRLCALDGTACPPRHIIERLNTEVGHFGIGRYTGLEELQSGVKVQEIREMPAATILFDAYRRLESAVLPAECIREKLHQEQLWVREAVEGRWFGELRAASQSFMQTMAVKVSGVVVYRVSQRDMQFTSIVAEEPLYVRSREQYEQSNPRMGDA